VGERVQVTGYKTAGFRPKGGNLKYCNKGLKNGLISRRNASLQNVAMKLTNALQVIGCNSTKGSYPAITSIVKFQYR
jgi:hypothetical protein